MKLKAGREQLASAFRGLTPAANVLHIFRLLSIFVAFSGSFVSLVGPALSIEFYNVKINCSHLDLSKGIYDSLRSSVTENYQVDSNPNDIGSHFPVDESLTNSEISILSQYAEDQVKNAPQFFKGSLFEFCVGYYNVTPIEDTEGNIEYERHDDKLNCSRNSGINNFFDYISTLERYNMEGVLAYSLETSNYTNAAYYHSVAAKKTTYSCVPFVLGLHCVGSLFILLFQYVLYSNRNGARDLKGLPKFLSHFLTIGSILLFILSAVGAGISTSMILRVKNEISNSFGTFGINLVVGAPWFIVLWFGFGGSAFFMWSWVIPQWCADPEEKKEFNETYNYARPGDYGRRVVSRQSQMLGNKDKKNPRDQSLYNNDDSEEEDEESYKGGSDDLESSIFYDDASASKSSSSPTTVVNKDVFYNYKEEEETNKLRRLGESLSRNVSVRHLNQKMNKRKHMAPLEETELVEMSEDAARNFLDDHKAHSPLPHHYRVETFDGFNEVSNSNSIKRSSTKGSKSSNRSHVTNPFLSIEDNEVDNQDSTLNDDEVNYLESNPFVNRL